MHRVATLLTLVALTTAGCVQISSDDPFAYMEEPLFSSRFDLSGPEENETRQFHVNDGSIVRMRLVVGGEPGGPFALTLVDPSDNAVTTMRETGEKHVAFAPGTWKVRVASGEEASGHVDVQVLRA